MRTPAVVGERLPVDLETVVDHSWLVLDGILFCVAGSVHTATAVAGCAYWIRADVAADLSAALGVRDGVSPAAGLLTFGGSAYRKLPSLARPDEWPAVHAALSAHGVAALPRTLLGMCDPAHAVGVVEPRYAARRAAALPVHVHGCGRGVLSGLLAALGDPAGEAGLLGLTGSAALDPARLCTGADLDLLVYPGVDGAALDAAIVRLGGVHLADLAPGDARLAAFERTRFLPAGPRAGDHRLRLWARRRDVAWIGDVRVDLTAVPGAGRLAARIPYAGADLGAVTTQLDVTAVDRGYPTRLTGRTPDGRQLTVWITARGYDAVLRPGDRVHLSGRLRAGSHPATSQLASSEQLATVDDQPGHHLHLEEPA